MSASFELYGCRRSLDCQAALRWGAASMRRDSKPRRGCEIRNNWPLRRPDLDLPCRIAPSLSLSPSFPAARAATSKARASIRRCQRIKATAGRFHPQFIFDALPHSPGLIRPEMLIHVCMYVIGQVKGHWPPPLPTLAMDSSGSCA